jgi:hypothetical protein
MEEKRNNVESNISIDLLLADTPYNKDILFNVLPRSLSSFDKNTSFSDYFVAVKQDGIFFKMVNIANNLYLIGRDFHVEHVSSNFPLKEKKYIFDVERVGSKLVFLDLMYMTNYNYGFGRRYTLIKMVVDKLRTIESYELVSQHFVPFSRLSVEEISNAEGIIFIHNGDKYDEQRLFKWKNKGYNTIDFEVREKNVYLKDYLCGPTTIGDGIYSVDVDTYRGNVRTDKKTSNSYEVAMNVLYTSTITYGQIEDVFQGKILFDVVKAREKMKTLHMVFFRAYETKRLEPPKPVEIKKAYVPFVEKIVERDYVGNCTPLVYIKKNEIEHHQSQQWKTSIFSSDIIDKCVSPVKITDRYSVSGERHDNNYIAPSAFDKVNTKSNLSKLEPKHDTRMKVVHFSRTELSDYQNYNTKVARDRQKRSTFTNNNNVFDPGISAKRDSMLNKVSVNTQSGDKRIRKNVRDQDKDNRVIDSKSSIPTKITTIEKKKSRSNYRKSGGNKKKKK